MRTREFKELVEDRFLEFRDSHPDLYLRVTKETGNLNMRISFRTSDRLNWQDFYSIIETFDIIRESTQYEPIISVDYHRGFCQIYVTYYHNENSL
jgi:hypothetical protein